MIYLKKIENAIKIIIEENKLTPDMGGKLTTQEVGGDEILKVLKEGDSYFEPILFDTTLRDGSQSEGVSFSIGDKIKIAQRLDDYGIHYIEGGWPGSNPKDEEFFL